ncbi:MAG: PTS sugar transporter subunit IIB [Suipraeoptans sp.]
MKKLTVMLCCGAGISSGLLAQQTRKASKKRKIDAQIEARSESEVYEYYPYLSILLLGPHYASQLEEFRSQTEEYDFPVEVIPQKIYGSMDGEGLLDFILEKIEDYNK